VLIQAGPAQAASWRTNTPRVSAWRGALPELIFPLDRSWLASTLWDDDWRCIGGPVALIEALVDDPRCETRIVHLGEDATPPGHRYY
jgi:hypothetical protein